MADKMTWAGRAVTALSLFPFMMGAYLTLSGAPQAAEGMAKTGWPASASGAIMALMLGSVAMYLIPPTAVLGAVLLTGYLGGAVATHREPRLRTLLPFRKPPA